MSDSIKKAERRLRVLSFTTLYPNKAEPFHGLFVKNRNEKMASYCDLDVVAPVNCTRRPGLLREVPKVEDRGGIPVYHPRFAVIPGVFKHWDGWLLFRQILPQISKKIDLKEYDILDIHYAYPDGMAGMLLARKMGKPYMITLHGSDINVLTQFPKRRAMIADVLKNAVAIVAVSDVLKKKVEALGASPERIHLIPNGVDTSAFYPREKMEARLKLGWPLDSHVVLFIGRLAPVKGLDLLIQSIKVLKETMKEKIRCYIVGDGELRPALEKEINRLGLEDTVIMTGWVHPSELPYWYSATDVFCLTSHSEGCPTVLVESMACGTPAVATAVGGIPNMIDEGVTGLLIKNRDVEEATTQIRKSLDTQWDKEGIMKSRVVLDWSEVAKRSFGILKTAAGI